MTTYTITRSGNEYRTKKDDPNPKVPQVQVPDEAIPTHEQCEAAWNDWSSNRFLNSNPDMALAAAERYGLLVPAFGIKLLCGKEDRAKFSQLLVMLREAEELLPADQRDAFKSSDITFSDANGSSCTRSVTAFRQLMVEYGQAYNALWARTL